MPRKKKNASGRLNRSESGPIVPVNVLYPTCEECEKKERKIQSLMTTNELQLKKLNQMYLFQQQNKELSDKLKGQEKQLTSLTAEVGQLREWLKQAQARGLFA